MDARKKLNICNYAESCKADDRQDNFVSRWELKKPTFRHIRIHQTQSFLVEMWSEDPTVLIDQQAITETWNLAKQILGFEAAFIWEKPLYGVFADLIGQSAIYDWKIAGLALVMSGISCFYVESV